MRDTMTEVGLDAWRRLNHKYDPRNPCGTYSCRRRCLRRRKLDSDVVASTERLEQRLRVVRRRFGDDVQNLWKSIHMVCIQKICLKILRDQLAVEAASVDSPEKQRLTTGKFLQANVHGSGASPMDVHALAKTKGGKKGGKGKDKENMSKKLDGNCFWCGAHGHMMEDCQKKAVGKPQAPKSPPGPIRNKRAKAKGAKARREHHPLMGAQMVKTINHLVRKSQ